MSPDYAHHFSERNIPFGIASSAIHSQPQAVTRLGNDAIFLQDLFDAGVFSHIKDLPSAIFGNSTLNEYAALSKNIHNNVRDILKAKIKPEGLKSLPNGCREDVHNVTMHMPVEVKDFTDFSCSLFHVENAGRIITGSKGAPPSFSHFPLGYQGRTASIIISGEDVERPLGHFRAPAPTGTTNTSVIFGPSERVDYEVELAAVIGRPLPMRQRLRPADAEEHIFGYVLMNDWSARDIQAFEMAPLGPFNGKSLGTSISPWIITAEALQAFQVPAPPQSIASSSPLYEPSRTSYDITLEVEICAGDTATKMGSCPVQSLFWTPRQMITHSVSSGSALRTGDLLATGTISGKSAGTYGCLLEATEGGSMAAKLQDGSERTFLQDGDTVRIVGVAGGAESGVGFGECVGKLVQSRPLQSS